MKRVVIVRHAKAVPYGYDDDFNRDLIGRGKNDANIISKELRKDRIAPDIIISSPARRAIKTARIFADNLEYDRDEIIENEDLYFNLTTGGFIDIIRSLTDDADTVFFFGHNPDFHTFSENLLEHYIRVMPTCSTVGIDFDANNWQNIGAREGTLAFHLIPKMFK